MWRPRSGFGVRRGGSPGRACCSSRPAPRSTRPSRAGLPPPLTSAAKPPAASSAVTPVGGQMKAGEGGTGAAPVKGPVAFPAVPAAATQGKPLAIDLPTALALTNASPLDVQIAGERLRAATAALDRAKVLWLPNIGVGVDYYRHDGQIQDIAGTVFTTSRSSLLVGGGPTAVLPIGEALYAPLAARQVVRARHAGVQAAQNDTTLAVAEAYFTVQQARGEVAGSIDTLRRAEELVKLTEKVAPDLAPTVEANRAQGGSRPPAAGGRGRLRAVAGVQRRPDPRPAARTRHAGRAGRGAGAGGRTARPERRAGRPHPDRADAPPGTRFGPGTHPGRARAGAAGEGAAVRPDGGLARRRVADAGAGRRRASAAGSTTTSPTSAAGSASTSRPCGRCRTSAWATAPRCASGKPSSGWRCSSCSAPRTA